MGPMVSFLRYYAREFADISAVCLGISGLSGNYCVFVPACFCYLFFRLWPEVGE